MTPQRYSVETIYNLAEDFYFKKVKANKKQLFLPTSSPNLFNFYDEFIIEPFWQNNKLGGVLADFVDVMFWAIYRVWAKKVKSTQSVIVHLNDDEKQLAIKLFIENIESEEDKAWIALLEI